MLFWAASPASLRAHAGGCAGARPGRPLEYSLSQVPGTEGLQAKIEQESPGRLYGNCTHLSVKVDIFYFPNPDLF